MMMRRSRLFQISLVLVVLLAASGCYTVLRHPTGPAVVSGGAYYRTCADCHADAAFYHPYYHYGWSHYGWRAYYGSPWWYDDYWWCPDDEEVAGDGPEIERGTRHLWGAGGWASRGWGFSRPSGQGQSRPRVTKPKEEEHRDAQEADEDQKEKSQRNLWKKRKKVF